MGDVDALLDQAAPPAAFARTFFAGRALFGADFDDLHGGRHRARLRCGGRLLPRFGSDFDRLGGRCSRLFLAAARPSLPATGLRFRRLRLAVVLFGRSFG